MYTDTDIVVVAWNGEDEALRLIDFDTTPHFHVLVFDYSGRLQPPFTITRKRIDEFVSIRTEFKGALIHQVAVLLNDRPFRYIGLLDDDQQIRVSDLNRLLTEAAALNADSFQPSITSDSYHSHPQFLQKPHHPAEPVHWVEIMAPFIRKEILEAGRPFFRDNISSYGLDRYLFPYLQRMMGLDKKYLIHSVGLAHTKPVTDGSKKFSNGLDARQEGEVLRKKVLRAIRKQQVQFSREELKAIYEVGTLRWDAFKYSVKRRLSLMS